MDDVNVKTDKVNQCPMVNLRIIREAVADYMRSEGCGCCRDTDAHEANEKRIAKLLDVPMYDDESGYDFSQFQSKKTV